MSEAPYGSTAKVYDLLNEAAGKDYGREAAELHALIQARKPGAASLLDVACGTGRHLALLGDRYDVAGVDLQLAMLAIARERLPGCPLVQGDLCSFELGRTFDAVTCLFSSVAYLRSGDELHRAVRAMARHLASGGVVIIDGWVRPDAWHEPGRARALAANGEGVAVARVDVSRREGQRTILEMDHLIGTLAGVEHVVERHEMTLFTDDEYRGAFTGAGLAVELAASPYADRDRYIGVLEP